MTGRQIRHPGHLRVAVDKAMPAKPAPDYRDVLNLSDEDPSRTPLTLIAHQLHVKLVHGIAAAIFAVLGIATLLGAGESLGF